MKTTTHGLFRDLDYIEVGDLDVSSLTLFLSGTDVTCNMAHSLRTWHSHEVVGFAVDPFAINFKHLPNLPNVVKLNVCMGCANAEWNDVAEINFEQLCVRYSIQSVEVLKISGKQNVAAIIDGVIDYCDTDQRCYPRIIGITAVCRSYSTEYIHRIVDMLAHRGYQILSSDRDVIMKRSLNNDGVSLPKVICCKFMAYGYCEYGPQCFFDHVNNVALPTHSSRCCFGKYCIRGHADVKTSCSLCSRDAGEGNVWCIFCWDNRAKKF